MAKLKVIWHTTAYNRYSSIIAWYVMNCGNSFAKTFIEDVDKKLELLSFMPALGRTMPQLRHRISVLIDYLASPEVNSK